MRRIWGRIGPRAAEKPNLRQIPGSPRPVFSAADDRLETPRHRINQTEKDPPSVSGLPFAMPALKVVHVLSARARPP